MKARREKIIERMIENATDYLIVVKEKAFMT